MTYFRVGMVVGAQSESYRTLRYLVQAPSVTASIGREVQIGGPDVLSYGEMLDRIAAVLDLRRRPRLPSR